MELQGWREFYRLYPFDDYHRFHRPAALIASADAKDRASAVNAHLDWLQPKPLVPDFNDIDLKTIAALGGSPPAALMKARTE